MAGYVSDFVASRLFREFRQLPPNHLRVRVGVRNRVFLNQVHCLNSGVNFWLHAFSAGMCSLNSDIVEIACGYGRKPMHLKKFEMQGERFTGTYVGIDIDEELIKFARVHFPAPQFQFFLTTHKSDTYGNRGSSTGKERYRFEMDDNSRDFVFSTSLFTHLLEPEMRNYIEESQRVLRPGGTMQMNFFCHDYLERTGALGDRWSFPYRIGNTYVESEKYPEAACAYTEEFMKAECERAGFQKIEIICDPTGKMKQSFFRCKK